MSFQNKKVDSGCFWFGQQGTPGVSGHKGTWPLTFWEHGSKRKNLTGNTETEAYNFKETGNTKIEEIVLRNTTKLLMETRDPGIRTSLGDLSQCLGMSTSRLVAVLLLFCKRPMKRSFFSLSQSSTLLTEETADSGFPTSSQQSNAKISLENGSVYFQV